MDSSTLGRIDKTSSVPLYLQLEELIKQDILSCRLVAGAQVSSERELCEIFGVSRITAVRAISDLVNDGILYRQAGKGTFVADPEMGARKNHTLGIGLYDAQYLFLPFFSCIIGGMAQAATVEGYQLQIVTTDGNNGGTVPLYSRILEQKQVDGLAVIDHKVSDSQLVDLHAHGVPIVLLDRVVRGEDFCSVLVDNRGGAFQIVEHLVELGHQHIGFVGIGFDHPPIREFYEGYRSALEVRGVEFHPQWVIDGGGHAETADAKLERVVGLTKRPTAIVCYNDDYALRAINLLGKLGCEVPDDISVTGFDNIPQSEYTRPSLTTADPHLADLGRQMAEMLLAQIRGEDPTMRRHVGPAHLVARDSSAPPSQ